MLLIALAKNGRLQLSIGMPHWVVCDVWVRCVFLLGSFFLTANMFGAWLGMVSSVLCPQIP